MLEDGPIPQMHTPIVRLPFEELKRLQRAELVDLVLGVLEVRGRSFFSSSVKSSGSASPFRALESRL